MPPSRPHRRRHARGTTLVEVLVSILVVSTGLFGAAALQANAAKNNQGSYDRTVITVAMQGMLDAIRSNRANIASYSLGQWTCAAPGGASLAASDQSRWITNLRTQVNDSACVALSCDGATQVCTMGVQWDDARSTGGAQAQQVFVRGQL